MFCENCGKQTPDGQRLCPECAGQSAPQVEAGETQVLDNLAGYMPMAYQHQVPQQPQQPYQAPQPTYQPQYTYQPQQAYQQPQQSYYQQPQQGYYQQPQQAYQQPQQEYAQPQYTYEQPQQEAPAFEVSRPAGGKKKPAKKGGKGGLIVGAVALVVVIALVALFWGNISRFIARNFGDPTDYLVMVEKKNAEDALDGTLELYSTSLAQLKKMGKVATEANVSLELGDATIALLETALEQQGLGIDMNWLEQVNVSALANVYDGDYALDMDIGINGKKLATAKVILDTDAGEVYLAVPELNETYLMGSLEDFDVDAEEVQAMLGEGTALMQTVLNALPEAEKLDKLADTYLDLVLGQLKDVEKQTKTVKVGGVEQELLVLTVKLSQRDLLEIADVVLKYAKTDRELLAILDDMSDMANSMPDAYQSVDLRAQFLEEVEYMLQDMDEMKADVETEPFLTLDVYVDNDDVIVGRTLTIEEYGDQQQIYYICATKGDKFAFEADLSGMSVKGSGTKKNDIITGQFVCVADGMELMTVELNGFGTNKDGKLGGTIRLIPDAAMLEEFGMDSSITSLVGGNLAVEVQLQDGGARFAVQAGGDTLLALAASYAERESSAISLPGDAVSVTDYDAAEEWIAGLSFDQIIGNMKNAGVSEELVSTAEMLAELFTSQIN